MYAKAQDPSKDALSGRLARIVKTNSALCDARIVKAPFEERLEIGEQAGEKVPIHWREICDIRHIDSGEPTPNSDRVLTSFLIKRRV